MARPDGRAFCALWAQGRRAAAHSGGPRPSRPASASLRPRSGRGPSGGPRGPGLGPALPTRRPRGLVLLTARQGDASPAGWWGAPVRALWARPSRPQRPAGRYPCPPWAAWAPPAPPACGGRGYVAAGRRLRRLRSAPLRGLPAASRCAGVPLRKARPSPCGARLRRGLALLLPRAGRGVGAPARPGPHSVGAVGPSAPPARACLASASRPALARLRLCPRWCGSACARPARRSGPARLRRPAAESRAGSAPLSPAAPVRGLGLAVRRGPCAAAI